jgi:hypothetical protein
MRGLAPTYEDRLKREIRDAIALDAIATIPELTDCLNKRLGHFFDPRYIKRIWDIVSYQIIIESDRMRFEDRMKITRENRRIARDEVLAILHSVELAKDRVEAAKAAQNRRSPAGADTRQ